jgi:DNA repair protein RadC
MIELKSFERSPNLAELKVSYRRRRRVDRDQLTLPWMLSSSYTAEKYLRSVWNPDTLELVEEFLVICLNGRHEVLGWVKVASGGFNSAPVDPRVVFSIALKTAASAILLAHNHPSTCLEPSAEDKEVTARLKDAGALLGIRVLDHVILTADGAFSFADAGLL